MTIIPYGKHYIDESDIEAVVNVLRSGALTQGPMVTEFESSFARYVNSKYAVAVSSCTAGLHIASIAAGLKQGDTLITSPITFVSSANAGLHTGATVAFSDINPYTINIDPNRLASTLEKYPKTKVVIPVHFAGLPCEMENLKAVCDQADCIIIEDAAHALGSKYKNGQMVGSCCHSLMTVFSLHPVKAIAAGEGGVITTNDASIFRRLLRLRSHGINKQNDQFICTDQAMTSSEPNPWYYEMQELGYHYRITDIQCALANSQLKQLPKFIARRQEIAERYVRVFSGSNILRIAQPLDSFSRSAWHLFVLRINFKGIKINRATFMNILKEKNIITQVHYLPVPMHPFYRKLNASLDEYKHSIEYYRECLSIPIFYSLSDEDQDYVISTIQRIIKGEML